MWNVVAASVTGTSHEADGRPCQDAHAVIAAGDAIVLVCADGAGSASRAEAGAAATCEAASAAIRSDLDANATAVGFDIGDALRWCEAARAAIVAIADAEELPPREFACTLLAAVVDETGAAFVQIGDGAIVASAGGVAGVVFWPQAGEFAGTTYFLTDEAFAERIEFVTVRAPIGELAVFSDGLERLALRFAERLPHRPFFDPMLARLRESSDGGAEFAEPLRTFLASDRINARTDDDKTLLLATRRPAADDR